MSDRGARASSVVPYASAYGVDDHALQEALRAAAVGCLETFDEQAGRLGQGEAFADTGLSAMLPAGFAPLYDTLFLARFRVCLVVVGWKLAQPEPQPLTCVAEELAFEAIVRVASERLESRGRSRAQADLGELFDVVLEDTDFRALFAIGDPVETELIDISGELGATNLAFARWFEPFGDGADRGAPHPLLWPPHTVEPR